MNLPARFASARLLLKPDVGGRFGEGEFHVAAVILEIDGLGVSILQRHLLGLDDLAGDGDFRVASCCDPVGSHAAQIGSVGLSGLTYS